jgi:ribosomal protein L37E
MYTYEPGYEKYAEERFDKEEQEYLSAVETSKRSVEDIMLELMQNHEVHESIKQEVCQNCGRRALKERRGRMRVFGGLFWTDSKVSPFKYCAACGHEQEANSYSHKSEETYAYEAQMVLKRAERLRAKYEDSQANTKPERELAK